VSPAWQVIGLISAALTLLSIWQLQRRSLIRLYPFLAAFLLAELLVNIAQWSLLTSLQSTRAASYVAVYWATEFSLQFLIVLTMISFLYRALEGKGSQSQKVLLAGLIIVGPPLVTIFTAGMPELGRGRWPGILTRNLSFGAALFNVFLWQSLLKYQRMAPQLLMLSLGVGIWTTGRAIGHSLRLLHAGTAGNVIVVVSELLGLLVWYWALSRFQAAVPATSPSTPQPTTPA
jgi:hypothetical protein